jgi:membrane-associated phospholipid phosphatase
MSPRERIEHAYKLRKNGAEALKSRPPAPSSTNGDPGRYPTGQASFAKGLAHDARGEVEPAAFKTLKSALESGRPEDFAALPLGGGIRLVNPQAAWAYALECDESTQVATPPPPAFASAELAAEACELYWQALTRDVPFGTYEKDPVIAKAAADLSRLSAYRGPRQDGHITAATVFRGSTRGDLVGPYVSQFLWQEVPYGSIRLVQQVRTATPGLDYMVRPEDWLAVQNGAPATLRHASAYRYIRSARDLAAYVHLDFSYQAFLTACLVLFGFEGTTDAHRVYKGAPFDTGNPYRGPKGDTGFVTFGVVHVLDLVARVTAAALRPCWYQKWLVHLQLRPEEYAGRVHHHRSGAARYAVHDDILHSAALDEVHAKHGSYLLPQAYPEGCPLHPSYPAGHAVVAGACATVLKAFFDESFPIDDPVVCTDDGLHITPYQGRDLTVGGELDKLASNIAMARNAAGIHWRSDAAGGLVLGEAVALSLLAEIKDCVNESFGGFSLTKFDGTRVTV